MSSCVRSTRNLKQFAVPCCVGLVARVMRALDLRTVQSWIYPITTTHEAGGDYKADLLSRDFTSTEPGIRLAGAITIVCRQSGWCHLTNVIEQATLMVVGLRTTDHMCTALVIDALALGRLRGHRAPRAIIRNESTRTAPGRGLLRRVLQLKMHSRRPSLPNLPQALPDQQTV